MPLIDTEPSKCIKVALLTVLCVIFVGFPLIIFSILKQSPPINQTYISTTQVNFKSPNYILSKFFQFLFLVFFQFSDCGSQ